MLRLKAMLRCPLCQSQGINLFNKYPNRILFNCLNCNIIFVWPLPGQKYIKDIYKTRKYYQNNKDKIIGYRNYNNHRKILTSYYFKKLNEIDNYKIGKKGKVLDVGCAYGFFLQAAKKWGWQVTGVDISPYAIKMLKKNKIKGIVGDLRKIKFPQNSFDLVTTFHTLEHANDPVSLLKEIKRILKPGGMILVGVPDQKCLLARLLGKKWHGWQHEPHLFWFDKKSLYLLLNSLGFIRISIKIDNHPRGSLFDIFDTLKERYPSSFTKLIYRLINYLPSNSKIWLKSVSQPAFGDIIVFCTKK